MHWRRNWIKTGRTPESERARPDPIYSHYYNRDHLGSIREVMNADGTLAARYDYDPFGKRQTQYLASAYTGGCDLGYTGHITQQSAVPLQGEIVLTFFRAYDPDFGRWLSADPIGELGGLNLYVYVGNDPLNLVDPFGLREMPWPFNGSAINYSDDPIFVLIGGKYKKLCKDEESKNDMVSPMQAEDVDGVWAAGKFYPVEGGTRFGIDEFGNPMGPRNPGTPAKVWDGTQTLSAPFHPDSPRGKGAPTDASPPKSACR